MKDGVRIAVVGAGAIAQLTHIPVLSKLRGASLVALCDDDGAKARALADRFRALGRAYLDLTVMQDNAEASALYEKLGFVRVPVF